MVWGISSSNEEAEDTYGHIGTVGGAEGSLPEVGKSPKSMAPGHKVAFLDYFYNNEICPKVARSLKLLYQVAFMIEQMDLFDNVVLLQVLQNETKYSNGF